MARRKSQQWRKEVTAILNKDRHRVRKPTAEKSLATRNTKHEHRRRQKIRQASKKIVGDDPLERSHLFAASGAKLKSEEQVKQEWNSNRRQDRRWLHDLIKRGDELAPSERERQAFISISMLSTLDEIHEALEEDDVLRKMKFLYIIVLQERKEAIKTLRLRDTNVVQDWWSLEKPWILGGDLPEEGARDIAYAAYYQRPEENVAEGQTWANPTARIHGHDIAPFPNVQFGSPLLSPGFDNPALEEPGVEMASGDDSGSEEMRAERMRRAEDEAQARGEELDAMIAGWDDGAGGVGMQEEGETRSEGERTELAPEQFKRWSSLEPEGAASLELETAKVNEEPRTPEDQIMYYDY